MTQILFAREGGQCDGRVFCPPTRQDLDRVERAFRVEFRELEDDGRAHGSFQGPLAIGQGPVLARVVGALDGIAARHHVVVALFRTGVFIRPVAAIVLRIAPQGAVDALAV